MRKQTASKIDKSYWKTEAGQRIAGAMHSDGWEASDCLTSVIDILEQGIAATADAATVEELKKARQQLVAAKNAYWKASAILHDGCF